MGNRKTILLSLLLMLATFATKAQELNCTVEVIAQKLSSADPKIFKTLQSQIYDFMNSRKWTSDVFGVNERIECKMLINVTEELGSDNYRATVSIQSSRPIFNSSYNSVLLNYSDKDWVFDYVEYQPLEFNENVFTSNLTSMLSFYAYMIIGMDYDSYALKGGTPYFLKAQSIMNTVPQTLGDKAPGWKPFDGTRNRYWMVENLTNAKYDAIRDASYLYHLKGLDLMYDNIKVGRQNVLAALKKMEPIVRDFPSTMAIQMFFDAKRDELISMFSKATPNDKNSAYQSLVVLDPTNAEKYSALLKN